MAMTLVTAYKLYQESSRIQQEQDPLAQAMVRRLKRYSHQTNLAEINRLEIILGLTKPKKGAP